MFYAIFLFGGGEDSIPHVWNVHILFLLWVEKSHLDSECLVFTVTLTEFHLLFLLCIDIILPNLALLTHLTARSHGFLLSSFRAALQL